jgi:hypothetical protein
MMKTKIKRTATTLVAVTRKRAARPKCEPRYPARFSLGVSNSGRSNAAAAPLGLASTVPPACAMAYLIRASL